MNYPRILAFSLLVLLALLLPGLTLAMMLGWEPLLFGHTPEEAGMSFQLIEQVATNTAVILTYVWLLWPITAKLLAHAAIVFFAVEAFQSVLGLIFCGALADALAWQAFLADALYAAIGVLLVIVWRSIRPRLAR
ncbi:MAG: hypothetical protein RSP_03910 [Rhodanobacter sp.]